jgi:putative transcriptional regulator
MTPKHHPMISVLKAASAGTLPPAARLIIEAHRLYCKQCDQTLQALDGFGGALLDTIEPIELSKGAFERLMSAIDAKSPPQSREQMVQAIDLPETLVRAEPDLRARGNWRFAGIGVQALDLSIGAYDGTKPNVQALKLIQIGPNRRVPAHNHRGREWTLVLSGAFHDEDRTYGPGDVLIMDPGRHHHPIGDAGGPCTALILNEAPLAFTGVLGLAQRLWNGLQ